MTTPTLDLTSLRNALASLDDALGVVGDESWFAAQSPKVRNTLMAGVVQNFEFVYEIGVKMLKRRLEFDSATPGEIDRLDFRDLLRLGGERGLIDDVSAWFEYRRMRNITAHTYDEARARPVLAGVQAFVADARDLLQRLEPRHG